MNQIASTYTRDDGAFIRIDQIKEGWVYFRSWRGGNNERAMRRMKTEVFLDAIRKAGMREEGV